MSLPLLTEDEIFGMSIPQLRVEELPPLSPTVCEGELPPLSAEDLDCFDLVEEGEKDLDCFGAFVQPENAAVSDLPAFELSTPTMQAHMIAVDHLMSINNEPLEDMQIPDDPGYVFHSIANWPNVENWENYPWRNRGSRSGVQACPATGVKASKAAVLAFAKEKSVFAYPFALPNIQGKVCTTPPMLADPTADPLWSQPIQQFPGQFPTPTLPPALQPQFPILSSASVLQQFEEVPSQAASVLRQFEPTPSEAPAWVSASQQYFDGIDPASAPGLTPGAFIPSSASTAAHSVFASPTIASASARQQYVEGIPMSGATPCAFNPTSEATAVSSAAFTTSSQCPEQIPELISHPSMTRTPMLGSMCELMNVVLSSTGGVPPGMDTSTGLGLFQSRAQVEKTTPSSTVTAPLQQDLEDAETWQKTARELPEAHGSDLRNRSATWSSEGSPIDWPNAIDVSRMPPCVQASESLNAVVENPSTVVPESVPEQLPERRYTRRGKQTKTVPTQTVPEPEHLPGRRSTRQARQTKPVSPPTEPAANETQPPGSPPKEPAKKRQTTNKRQGEETAGEDNHLAQPAIDPETAVNKVRLTNGRLKWTPELHAKFVKAVFTLGPENATPRKILNLINISDVNIYHVKSHLQKFRQDPGRFEHGSGSSTSSEDAEDEREWRRSLRHHKRQRSIERAEQEILAQHAQAMAASLALERQIQQEMPHMMQKSRLLQEQLDLMEKQGVFIDRMMTEKRAWEPIDGDEAPA